MGGFGEEVAEKCSEAQALSGALVHGEIWVEAARGVAEWGRGRNLCAVLPQRDPSAVCLMVSLSGRPQRLEMKQGIGRMPSRSGNANNGLEHKV